MTTLSFPSIGFCSAGLETSKSYPSIYWTRSNLRLPTDPLYFAQVDVKNMVVGSRWSLGYYVGGVYTELSQGTCASSDFSIPNVPSYSALFLMELRTRKSSASVKYKPSRTYAYHAPVGVSMYVSQVEDEVAA